MTAKSAAAGEMAEIRRKGYARIGDVDVGERRTAPRVTDGSNT